MSRKAKTRITITLVDAESLAVLAVHGMFSGAEVETVVRHWNAIEKALINNAGWQVDETMAVSHLIEYHS